MKPYSRAVLSVVIGSLLAATAMAQEPVALATDAALAARLDAEESALRPQRAAFQRHFHEAYVRYPAIPAGTLEAIAYVQSRWLNIQASAHPSQTEAHHHMPAAHGVMGLYAGEGFADQVAAGAHLLGVSTAMVRSDARTNVLAAAALLDAEIRKDALAPDPRSRLKAGGRRTASPEAIRPALMRYAGFDASPVAAARASAVGDYARTSFAYDVFLAQDRGVNDRGIVVPERAIEWEQAFDMDQLIKLRAPMIRLDVVNDRIETADYRIDPVTETVRAKSEVAGSPINGASAVGPDTGIQSTDYGPAIWDPAHASNYNASRSAAVSAVAIHTAQGSYAGTISWFKNPSANASAHYVIRSSDGQVTQMVRNAHTAWHVRSQNSFALGIEHEGYVNNSSWYTTAMYNASAGVVRNFCAKYSTIPCTSAYKGAPSSGINVLPTSVKIKGHQHYSGQTHTDPGINWNWSKYYGLLNPGDGGGTGLVTYLDRFESSVGHFTTSPSYSGSTSGISTASSATRDCTTRKNGSCSLQLQLKDNTSSSASWAVRLLAGAGSPGSNTPLARSNGTLGFWVWSGGTGTSVGVGIDDSDGTERSTSKSIPANSWTYVSWSLPTTSQWNAWAGGNGAITATTVKLDAIWLYHANTAYDVNVYIDDVQIKN